VCVFIVMEILRITRQIHCKAVEQRATLIHRQYNRDRGNSYSRPYRPIPHFPPPCYKILAAPLLSSMLHLLRHRQESEVLQLARLCVCVCVCVHEHIYVITRPIFTQFFLRVTYDHGSVLLRQRCDMSCIWGSFE